MTEMTQADRDHRERMAACNELQPCPKMHAHGPACYGAMTVYAVVRAFIERANAPKPKPAPAPRDTSRRTPDLAAQLTNAAFGDARRRK